MSNFIHHSEFEFQTFVYIFEASYFLNSTHIHVFIFAFVMK